MSCTGRAWSTRRSRSSCSAASALTGSMADGRGNRAGALAGHAVLLARSISCCAPRAALPAPQTLFPALLIGAAAPALHRHFRAGRARPPQPPACADAGYGSPSCSTPPAGTAPRPAPPRAPARRCCSAIAMEAVPYVAAGGAIVALWFLLDPDGHKAHRDRLRARLRRRRRRGLSRDRPAADVVCRALRRLLAAAALGRCALRPRTGGDRGGAGSCKARFDRGWPRSAAWPRCLSWPWRAFPPVPRRPLCRPRPAPQILVAGRGDRSPAAVEDPFAPPGDGGRALCHAVARACLSGRCRLALAAAARDRRCRSVSRQLPSWSAFGRSGGRCSRSRLPSFRSAPSWPRGGCGRPAPSPPRRHSRWPRLGFSRSVWSGAPPPAPWRLLLTPESAPPGIFDAAAANACQDAADFAELAAQPATGVLVVSNLGAPVLRYTRASRAGRSLPPQRRGQPCRARRTHRPGRHREGHGGSPSLDACRALSGQ